LRARRAALPPTQRSQAARAAARHLARACRRWNARHIAVYLNLRNELSTAPLIERLQRDGCAIYAPKLAPGGTLRFARLTGPFKRNRHGIREPALQHRPPRLDVIVMPLVAFDDAGRRLGMGGGYYDRLLARTRSYRRPLRIGFAYAAQEIPRVPAAAHDVRLHAVATESGVRSFR
jgi:5-formyltetrahydrofolate cyclo-ligase